MPVGGCPREAGCPKEANYVAMTLEELEAVRLVDLLDLEQEEAASFMGISRKAFWNDLVTARKKIAMALVYGTGILIEGGSYLLRGAEVDGTSPEQCMHVARESELCLVEREQHILRARLDLLNAKMTALKASED
jgi:predicted DNA-binding protein (UPF0251 family)